MEVDLPAFLMVSNRLSIMATTVGKLPVTFFIEVVCEYILTATKNERVRMVVRIKRKCVIPNVWCE